MATPEAVQEEDSAADPKPKPSLRSRLLLPLVLLAIVAIPVTGLVIGLLRHNGAHDVGSSDLKACSVVSSARLEQVVGASLRYKPVAEIVGHIKEHVYGGRSSVGSMVNTTIHDQDTCYLVFDGPGTGGSADVTIVPAIDSGQLDTFAAAEKHAVLDGASWSPLAGVGEQAAIGKLDPKTHYIYTTGVVSRVGPWIVTVDTVLPQATAVTIAKLYANGPRLQKAPGKGPGPNHATYSH